MGLWVFGGIVGSLAAGLIGGALWPDAPFQVQFSVVVIATFLGFAVGAIIDIGRKAARDL